MSTKTLRKRIALAAVSALGAGMLSLVAIPAANAAAPAASTAYISNNAPTDGVATVEATISVVTAGYADGLGTGYVSSSAATATAGATTTGTILPGAKIPFATKGAAGKFIGVVVSGGNIVATTGDGTISGSLQAAAGGTAATALGVLAQATGAVGSTLTVSFYEGTGVTLTAPTNGSYIGSFVLTVVAAGSSGIPVASKSSYAVNNAAGATATDVAAGFTVANGGTGYIYTTVKDAYSVALTGTYAYTVTATNGAYVGFTSAYPTASSAVATTVQNQIYVRQSVANKAVSTDVTLSVNGTVIGTKTIKFLGDIAKITVAVGGNAIYPNAGGNTDLIGYKAYDAAGNRVALLKAALAYKGADAVVSIAGGTDDATTSVTGDITPTCNTYGKNSALYVATSNAAGETIVSNTFEVSCAGDMYTYKASLDSKSYKQGEIATLTIEAFDVKGNPANDITAIGDATHKPAISGAYLTAVNAPVHTDTLSGGVIKYQFIVGNTAGSYSMAVDLPLITLPGGSDTSKTIGYSIASDGSVSNAEVLSAIVKLIASINKQIAALQKALTKKK